MDLWVREARIFKYGSGTGTNFSALRGEGEPLSGGGKSSGLMSFLKIGDRAAGAKVRRDHAPRGQDGRSRSRSSGYRGVHQLEGGRGGKGRGPGRGLQALNRHLNAILQGLPRLAQADEASRTSPRNPDLLQGHRRGPPRMIPPNYMERVLQLAQQGVTSLQIEEYNTDWTSRAYYTVSGQNSNNSVRIDNSFMEAVKGRPLAPLLADREGEGQD